MHFSKEQIAYIEREVKGGLPLMDAIGQAEVLEHDASFKEDLIRVMNDPKVIQALRSAIEWDGDRE